jgi:hypothetical protein
MTLEIDLSPETEQLLRAEAARLGLDEVECARRLIVRSLPKAVPNPNQATLDLLAQWDKEDQTDDPAEIERRKQEWEELKVALNRNRLESGGPNARMLFP